MQRDIFCVSGTTVVGARYQKGSDSPIPCRSASARLARLF
jgi:hypothetical protein